MKIHLLDKKSHVPLYYQLVSQLMENIRNEELKPGDKLPSEREIAEALNISRITARLAITELLDRGLLYREQGRGTFIAQSKRRSIQGFTSFTEDMLNRGLTPSSKVLAQEVITLDEVHKALNLQPGEKVIHIYRLRMANGAPVALQTSFLPYHIFPGLEKEDLSSSLFQILNKKYFVFPSWTEPEVDALPATSEEAELLDLKLNDPVLVVRAQTFTDSFEVVESVKTVYRGESMGLYLGRQRLNLNGN
jgi:GntR family transcriptional regulator